MDQLLLLAGAISGLAGNGRLALPRMPAVAALEPLRRRVRSHRSSRAASRPRLRPASARRSSRLDPAIRLSGPPKSGMSISASSRPAIQKICMWVKRAIRPSTATISNCSLWRLVRHALGQSVQPKEQDAEPQNGEHQDDGHHDHQHVRFTGSGDERRQMVGSSRVKRRSHTVPPIEDFRFSYVLWSRIFIHVSHKVARATSRPSSPQARLATRSLRLRSAPRRRSIHRFRQAPPRITVTMLHRQRA